MSVLPYLETFAAVVEKGSFTAAAETLAMSKPAVSKQVSQLEQFLGVQLLHRTTRRLHLTEAGEVFASHARRIVAEAQEAQQSILPLQSEPQGTLRVTASESLAMSLLSEALIGFRQRFPKVKLDLRISGRFVDLVEEGIDVALRVGELDDSSMRARRLMGCGFHVCASPDYWRRHGAPDHPNDLTGHNCLIYSQSPRADTWTFKDTKGKNIGVKVEGNLRSDAGNLLLEAAIHGQGVMIAPSYMISRAIAGGQLATALDGYCGPPTALYAVFPKSRHVSTKVRAFVDYLVEAWGEPRQQR